MEGFPNLSSSTVLNFNKGFKRHLAHPAVPQSLALGMMTLSVGNSLLNWDIEMSALGFSDKNLLCSSQHLNVSSLNRTGALVLSPSTIFFTSGIRIVNTTFFLKTYPLTMYSSHLQGYLKLPFFAFSIALMYCPSTISGSSNT